MSDWLEDHEASAVGAVTSTWHRAIDPIVAFPGIEDADVHDWVRLFGGLANLGSTVPDLLDALAASVSVFLPSAPQLALTLQTTTLGVSLPHKHIATGPLPPLPGIGPTELVGALSVQLGGVPALRAGDLGASPTCGSLAPLFKVLTGSSNVYVASKRAVRLGELTLSCFTLPLGAAGASAVAHAASQALHVVNTVSTYAGIASSLASAAADGASAVTVEGASSSQRMVMVAGVIAQVAQSAADVGLGMLSATIGLDPGPPGGFGLLTGVPTSRVLIGGFSCPEASTLMDAGAAWLARQGEGHVRVRTTAQPDANARPCLTPGHPVRVVDGSVYADHVDVDREGLRFARHHDTREREIGDCGAGVRHTYERTLEVWLHRVRYVAADGTRFELPPFRGRDRVLLHGCVVERGDRDRYRVTHGGETMSFRATPGVRRARLESIASGRGTIEVELDADGRFRAARLGAHALVATRSAEGRITRLADERGTELASYAYDDARLVAARDASGAEERFEHDAEGRPVLYEDARAHRFRWRYDAEGRCVHTSGEGGQRAFDFAYRKGVTTVSHASGLVETMHHDAHGIVLRVVRSDGGFLLRERDAAGRIVRERDAAGRVVEWLYDETGAHVGLRDRFGHPLPPHAAGPTDAPHPLARVLPARPRARMGLEPDGEPHAVRISAALDELATLAAWALPPPDAEDRSRVEHDGLGRAVRFVDPRGRSTELRRDGAGNVVSVVDRDRRETRVHVTGWNLAGATVDPLGRRTEATYGADEKVRTYRDPRGVVTTYGRDAAGRVTSIAEDGQRVETYAYDAGDRLLEKRDATGALVLRVTHHANALPARIVLAEGEPVELDYDARGRVTRAQQGEHDARLERDELGGVIADRVGDRGVRRWSVGVRETTSLFERFETRVDRTGDLVVVRDPTGRLSSFELGASGRVARTLANGTRELLAFDPEGRLEGRLAYRRASDGALASWAVRYERSAEGDLLCIWDTARGERRFELDAAHRLEAEVDERGERHLFTHDPCDDVVLPGTELDARGRILRSARESFDHDARGRLVLRRDLAGRTTRYGYDALDQLVWAELPDGRTWRGSYDGLGRLRRFGADGRETTLHWDGDRVAAETRPDGALRVHVYADARALVPFAFVDYASEDAEPESGRVYFVFHDASGMPTQIEDASGRTVWWADRVDPYGALTLHEIPGDEGAPLAYGLRWPGHVFDADLGLHHNRFRAYDPGLARYLVPDPIGHEGSPHSLYAYAPSPLDDVDLLGLATSCPASEPHVAQEPTEGHPLARRPGYLLFSDFSVPVWLRRLDAHARCRHAAGLVNGGWVIFPSVMRAGWDPETRRLRFLPDGSARDRAALEVPGAEHGIQYDRDGSPQLERFAYRGEHGEHGVVRISEIGTDRAANMAEANADMASRHPGWTQPEGYTWHECADGHTMVLVPTKLHEAIPHTGGVARAQAVARSGRVQGPPIGGGRGIPSLLPQFVMRWLALNDPDGPP